MTQESTATPARSTRGIAVAAVVDVVLVLVFVLIGRSNHGEDVGIAGTWNTFWPFLAGLALGWLVTRAWRNPLRITWPGVGIWVVTLVAGMLLRVASGQGIAVSFVIVALIVLGVLLLGWRAIARVVTRRRSSGAA